MGDKKDGKADESRRVLWVGSTRVYHHNLVMSEWTAEYGFFVDMARRMERGENLVLLKCTIVGQSYLSDHQEDEPKNLHIFAATADNRYEV